MNGVYFFGYGSLVNRGTHRYAQAHLARLTGWRRVWRHTALRQVAYLSVVRDEGAEIDGLIAEVPGTDWAELDAREGAYDRIDAAHQIDHPLPHAPQIVVYSVPGSYTAPPPETLLLLSYIDVVAQGYLYEYGEAAAAAFFAETHGWEGTVIDDRAAPRYPRHQRLTPSERGFVDDQLAALGVRPVRG